jgi:hypothetical protein
MNLVDSHDAAVVRPGHQPQQTGRAVDQIIRPPLHRLFGIVVSIRFLKQA